MALPINFKDDVLDTSVNTSRKFRMINNEDGTVSFEDVTTYLSVGSDYGATEINKTNNTVNKLNNKIQFLTGGFLLKDVTVNFANFASVIIDSRIKESSLAMIYVHDLYADDVYDANVTAKTDDGSIKFESKNEISSFVCDIYIVAESEEEE